MKQRPDHPWCRNLRHGGLENYYNLPEEILKVMMSVPVMITAILNTDPSLAAAHQRSLSMRACLQCTTVGLKPNKGVYLLDRHLVRASELITPALDRFHWKFEYSKCDKYTIKYWILPDWKYWIYEYRGLTCRTKGVK